MNVLEIKSFIFRSNVVLLYWNIYTYFNNIQTPFLGPSKAIFSEDYDIQRNKNIS